MGTLIVILLIVGAYVFYKKNSFNDSKWVKDRIKNRSAEQVAVIRYFCNDPSCLSKKPISDAEYDQMVVDYLNSKDFRKLALNKIGVDEDEVKEIEPIHFEGYKFGKNCFSKYCDDNKWRSSCYQVTWLFFSANEVFLYQNTFNMDEDGRKETTENYFYKDVTNFSTTSKTEETPVYDKKKDDVVLKNVDTDEFAITVPGDKLYCALESNDYTESSIKAMKAMLREKKNA